MIWLFFHWDIETINHRFFPSYVCIHNHYIFMSLSIPISILLYRDIYECLPIYRSIYLCIYVSIHLASSCLSIFMEFLLVYFSLYTDVSRFMQHSLQRLPENGEDTFLTISSAFIFHYWHENIQINGYLIWKVSQMYTHTHKRAFHNDFYRQSNWNFPLLHA